MAVRKKASKQSKTTVPKAAPAPAVTPAPEAAGGSLNLRGILGKAAQKVAPVIKAAAAAAPQVGSTVATAAKSVAQKVAETTQVKTEPATAKPEAKAPEAKAAAPAAAAAPKKAKSKPKKAKAAPAAQAAPQPDVPVTPLRKTFNTVRDFVKKNPGTSVALVSMPFVGWPLGVSAGMLASEKGRVATRKTFNDGARYVKRKTKTYVKNQVKNVIAKHGDKLVSWFK